MSMKLGESKVTQILDTYLNFCRVLQRDGEITIKNFNRIRMIANCIVGRQESVEAVWGDIFDEVYKLLEEPIIKSRLEQEEREVQLLRGKRENDKQKHLSDEESEALKKASEKNISLSSRKKSTKTPKRIEKHQTNFHIQENNIDRIRRIFWNSIEKAKQEEKIKQSAKCRVVQRTQKFVSFSVFDRGSSTFQDVMDERRAEGKGYG